MHMCMCVLAGSSPKMTANTSVDQGLLVLVEGKVFLKQPQFPEAQYHFAGIVTSLLSLILN